MYEANKIYESFKFLEEYDLNKHIDTDGRQCNISFYNEYGCFTYHSYPQFGDIEIFISDSLDDFLAKKYRENYSMNWIVEVTIPIWNKTNKNIKHEIIDLVCNYIKHEIQNTNKFFSIKVK